MINLSRIEITLIKIILNEIKDETLSNDGKPVFDKIADEVHRQTGMSDGEFTDHILDILNLIN